MSEPLNCVEHEVVFDEVISCDLPDGHEGPHQTVVIEPDWRPDGGQTTWWIRWQYESGRGTL